jgi:hypothetical protein
VLVLALGSAYGALVALEVVELGAEPGEGAPGGALVHAAVAVAFLAGTVTSVAHALERVCRTRLAWALLAPAGAAFLGGRWYAFDPYYLPTLRRYAEGAVNGGWVLGVIVACLAAGALAAVLPRVGALVSAAALVVTALTAWVLPFGK